MVEVPPEVTDEGVNETRAPAGAPDAVSPTVWGLPESVVVLTVLVAAPPATTEPVVGEAAMEKSPGGGGAAPALNRAMPAAQYMVVGKEPVKFWAAVEVRS